MTSKIYNAFLCILAFLVASCTSTTSIRHSQDYNTDIQFKKMLVMPPKVEVNTVEVGGKKKRMHEYEAHMSGLIAEQLVDFLGKQKISARILHKKDIHEQQLHEAVFRLRQEYDESLNALYKPLLCDVKKAFVIEKNIGDNVIKIKDATEADILVFVDYAQNVKTNGARTVALIKHVLLDSSDSVDDTAMFIGFIDANTGRILWANYSTWQDGIYDSMINNLLASKNFDIKHINKMFKFTLGKFPQKPLSPKVK